MPESELDRSCTALHPGIHHSWGLGIPTWCALGYAFGQKQLAYDSQGVISGVVCDILKAFNCFNRKVIHLLAKKGGLPPQLLTAWNGALTGLRRQIQIGGTLFGNQHSSSTGCPEGDPLSVTALFHVSVEHRLDPT